MGDKMKKKKIIWVILLIIGLIPFLIPLLFGIISFFSGFSFLSAYSKGFEAMFGIIFLWSFLFWPTYIIGAILIVLSIIKLKKI